MTADDATQAFSITFFLTVAVVALWENFWPRRSEIDAPLRSRWFGNAGLFFVDMAIVRLTFPMLCIGSAYLAAERDWGLFGTLDAPVWLAFPITFLAVDLGRYVAHRAFHGVPLFWRFHAIHHGDPDVDVSTGVRFHPLEALATTGLSIGIVLALGGPAEAVALSEIVSAIVSPWSHGKIRVPARIDRWLRILLVTPDVHGIHHSIERHEADSNYANTLIVWDRLFGTYIAAPGAGHERMTAGLTGFTTPLCLKLSTMLAHPFLPGTSRRDPAVRDPHGMISSR